MRDKKQASIFIVFACFWVSIIFCFLSLVAIGKLKTKFKSRLFEYYSNHKNYEVVKQIKILFIYLIIILASYLILTIVWLINITLIYNFKINVYNNAVNDYDYGNNISYLSTQSDLNENNQENIINNINDENKKNNICFLSQNIINKIEKEFKDNGCQTIIKANIYNN
jgi:ABC-type microcin C transport system permease subunit YejE